MADSALISIGDVQVGHSFPPVSVDLSAERVQEFLRVLDSEETRGRDGEPLMPPSATTTMTIGALLASISLPVGTLHISQDTFIHSALPVGTPAICHSKLANRSFRSGITFVTLDFTLTSSANAAVVMNGSATLLLGQG